MKNTGKRRLRPVPLSKEHYASDKTPCKTDSRHLNSTSGSLLFENLNEWLTSDEAAAYLKLSTPSLRNLVSNGVIPQYKLGNRSRFRLDDLRNLLLNNKKGGSL